MCPPRPRHAFAQRPRPRAIMPREETPMSLIQMTPITGPKAWRGADLAADTSWIVALTDAEVADLDRALATARASGRPLTDIDRARFPLSILGPRLEQAVAEMYDGRGFLLLRGL